MSISPEIIDLISKYSFNLFFAILIIRFIYHKNNERKNDFVFTYFMFNSLIFFFAYILGSLTINMGFAFGLFAVFAILRYRTNTIPIKEMTYLFIVITIGVINSLSGDTVDISVLILTNTILTMMAYLLENYWQKNYLISRSITYKKIENLKPENHDQLLIDLKNNTGLDIKSFDIKRMNLETGSARIKIYSKN
ncbi:MAG: DUF4956 domain-containing protein [Candidatus Marinimicrobia bacterium]|nr:DUF4956 domain-containing protein [Candidatus Neomarinimicrobiota bacterium]|tara:strand:- start:1003 stop:1584 length:582 start_codon:yes stop_codon:yes gene_type:complete